MLYYISRNARYFGDTLVLRTVYDALVCSIVEAGSIVWISGVISECNKLDYTSCTIRLCSLMLSF